LEKYVKIRTLLLAAAVSAMPFGAVACGSSDSSSKPSVNEITQKLKEAGAPDDQAECAAKALHDNLSAESLNKVMDSASDNSTSEDLTKSLGKDETEKMATAISKCLGIDTSGATSTN